MNNAQYRIIEENSVIWKWTSIWNYSHIRSWVKIWDNCNIWNNVYIDTNVSIWNGVKIQNWVNIFNWVTIGDDVFVWPSVTFTNDLIPRAFIWWIEKISTTIVKKWASIWANSTIRCGIELWEYCLIGSWTVVTKDVPNNIIVVWNPWKFVWIITNNWRIISNAIWNLWRFASTITNNWNETNNIDYKILENSDNFVKIEVDWEIIEINKEIIDKININK